MAQAPWQCQIQLSMSASRGVTSSQLHEEADIFPSPHRTSGCPAGGFVEPSANISSSQSFAPLQPASLSSRAHQC